MNYILACSSKSLDKHFLHQGFMKVSLHQNPDPKPDLFLLTYNFEYFLQALTVKLSILSLFTFQVPLQYKENLKNCLFGLVWVGSESRMTQKAVHGSESL
jgi:hypothetical protein